MGREVLRLMKVATCRKEITPKGAFFPCFLMGHAIRTEAAEGIMDPLWATALVLQIQEVFLIWITVELIGLERNYTEEIKQVLSDRYHIPVQQMTICFIHTHSAPEYQEHSMMGGSGAVPGYMDFVRQQILAAVDECFSGELTEVTVWSKTVEISGCYGNRNGKDAPADKRVTTLVFRSAEGVVAGIGSFACHSTVLGPQNRLVSSDLAGFVARELEKQWGVYPLIMVGAAGDMSNRLFRQGNDKAELERVGTEMMKQVFDEKKEIRLQVTKAEISTYRFSEIFYLNPESKKQQYDSIKEKIENARNFDEKKVYSSALAVVKSRMSNDSFSLDLVCRYIDMGDLKVLTVPAELFSRFGMRLKQEMGGKCPICWCYCDYSAGYLGNKEDYGNSFETACSDIPSGTTERIVEEMSLFIKEHLKKSI